MTTLADLRTQCRTLLASTTLWPNATLDRFIQDAIRAYSAEFPRQWRHTLSLTTGTQAYNLPGAHGFLGMVSVEYPVGEDPRRYLFLVDERDGFFRAGGTAYALRLGVADTITATADSTAGTILLAETVTTGESAALVYRGLHTVPAVAADTAIITVPDAHLEALIAFVDFRSHWQLEVGEASAPNEASIILSVLGLNGRKAWTRWQEIMSRLRPVEAAQGGRIEWGNIGL